MKLHLPKFLRKALLTCILAAAGLPACMSGAAGLGVAICMFAAPVSAAEGAAVATYTITTSNDVDLSFSGGSLNWNTDAENKVFSANGAAAAFRMHDNVTFDGVSLVTLEEDIQVTRMSVVNDTYVQVSTAGHGFAASEVSIDGTLKYQLDGSAVSVGELAGSGAIEIGNTSSQSGNFTVSGDCAGFSGSITARGDMAVHLSDNLLTNSLATIIIDSGAVLESDLGFFALLEMDNIQTKGSGVINLQQLEGAYLQKNVEINNNYEVHSDNFFLNGYWSDNRWNTFFRVDEGKSFSVVNHFAVESCVDLQISGGTVQSGTLHLGHWSGNFGDFWGKLTMTGGKLTTGTISLKLNHSNSINISGGTLEFTNEKAVDRESNTVTTIRIVGADNQNRVNFLATQCDWSLDGAGLNNKPVIGNVTIDAGNTHGITLRNVTLTGSIVNDAELTLDSGISVAANTTTTLSGDGQLSVHRTIANAGTFNLLVSQVSLDRSNLGYLQSGIKGATVRYSYDGTTYNTDGSENGFRFQTDGRYYLVAGGQYTVTQGSQVQLGDEAYELFCDGTGIGFIYPENTRSVEYFVNSGNVVIGAAARELAETYEINGGTMVVNTGSIAGERIHFNTDAAALNIGGASHVTGTLTTTRGTTTVAGGEVDALTSTGGQVHVTGGHIGSLLFSGGSATLSGGSSGSLMVGAATVEVTGMHTTGRVRMSELGASTVVIKDGGNLTLTGTNNEHSTNRSFMLAHWPYASTLRQEGGLLNSPGATMFISWDGTGTYEAMGGVANLAGISFWGNGSNIRGKFYLGEADGGTARVNIGANGISDISGSVQILLGNGTLGATADWRMHHNPSFTVSPVQLISTGQGTIFDTSDANYPTIGRTITVDVPFTGTGKLVKQGVGTLILNRASTHSGGTVIEAGELVAGNETALGSGKVSLTAGSLKLNTGLTIGELEYSGGALNLNGNTLNITGELAANRQLSLNCGILNIQNDAIYSGQGIIALEGSSATLRLQNAGLSHAGYDLVFNAGTTLELAGSNTIAGNVNLMKGSTLLLSGSEKHEIIGTAESSFQSSCGIMVTSELGIQGYGKVSFSGAETDRKGAAIFGDYGSSITLSDNDQVEFTGNSSLAQSAYGGAIYGEKILINRNDTVGFSRNSATAGAAIHGATVEFCDNGEVKFVGNVSSDGGIADVRVGGNDVGTITFTNNGSVIFQENTARIGVIVGQAVEMSLNGNTSVEFSDNQGNAIFGVNCNISLNDNDSVKFCRNAAQVIDPYHSSGAIYWTTAGLILEEYNNTVTLNNNKEVVFNGNRAQYGAAICGSEPCVMTLDGNGSVSFVNNEAIFQGGAIDAFRAQVILCNNESLEFRGNRASGSSESRGGAISIDSGTLRIQNNNSVEFYQNAEVVDGVYRLRSIYADKSSSTTTLSAAEGKSILFRDSIYISSGATFNLNDVYTDTEGNRVEQKGDIIFTGATTENDLYIVKGNVDGTDEEIRLSRTSEIHTMTNLYGGRLRVEDGAVYQGQGITVHEGSEATVRVKDAELNHAGYEMSFNAGTSLEVAGESTIRGNVALKEGSLFKLEQAAVLSLHETAEADAAILTVNGTAFLSGASTLNASLTLADGATLDMDNPDAGAVTLNGALTFGGQVTMGENLLAILLEMSAWGESVTLFTGIESLVLPVMASSKASNHVWVGDVFSNLVGYEQYYFNYVPDVGSLMVVHVPEPTTTTLGLLTLAGLTLRRRRK